MDNKKFKTDEEYLQVIKSLMTSLRGDWSNRYEERIYCLKSICEQMIEFTDPSRKDLLKDLREVIDVARNQLVKQGYHRDGRYFRDCCNLYDYGYNLGKTEEAYNFLAEECNYHFRERYKSYQEWTK